MIQLGWLFPLVSSFLSSTTLTAFHNEAIQAIILGMMLSRLRRASNTGCNGLNSRFGLISYIKIKVKCQHNYKHV